MVTRCVTCCCPICQIPALRVDFTKVREASRLPATVSDFYCLRQDPSVWIRRRVKLNANKEQTSEVVNTSTDLRITFDWTLPDNAAIEMSESKFYWGKDGSNWKEVSMVECANNRASLVITGVPAGQFSTSIYTKLKLAYKVDGGVTQFIEINAPMRTINDVAQKLANLTDNEPWSNYGKYLLHQVDDYILY